jgi:hypothetical protein
MPYAFKASAMFELVGNAEVAPIAEQVDAKLQRFLESI